MHHLLLKLLFLRILLLPKACTLKCYECALGPAASCSSATKQCSALENQCSAQRFIIYSGDSVTISDFIGKSCSFNFPCGESSANLGLARIVLHNKCCATNLCNNVNAPDYSESRPNGRKCYYCNGAQCTATVECKGSENYCITTKVVVDGQMKTTKGCVSAPFCIKNGQLEGVIRNYIGSKINCCEGNLCNSGSRPRVGLLLVTPLLLLVMSP
ncbi:urokinase plasminogen activator surface receptor-like [Corythoichthys intestinalis]|uniref:urokinase plasminogen activator surface receptor-like n=1 Tax=Corythoichthys intestinalis TaxID=161448 RepID=UPI0025A66EEC|nr:urokinase plasminogen activator surface receptor-like [Corythoichthys intestinalis]